MDLFDTSKSLIENLYYLSGVLILLSLLFGIFQLIYTKKTLYINSKREAAKLAAQQVEIYMARVIPLHNKMFALEIEKKIKRIKVEVGDFNNKYLIDKMGKEEYKKAIEERFKLLTISLMVINAMEAFSVYFVKGVADEEIAFSSVGRTFVNSVESIYFDIASFICEDNENSFQNLIQLYKLWKDRLKKSKLEKECQNLTEQLKTLEDISVKPIGVQ